LLEFSLAAVICGKLGLCRQGFVVEKVGKIGWNEVYLWSHKVVQKKTRKGRKQIWFMAVNSSS